MNIPVSRGSGEHLGGTVAAFFIAPTVLIVVAGISGFLWFLFNNLMTVIRPGVIDFMAAIVGGYVGTYCARASCDAVLKNYSRRAIFIELAILLAAAIVFEFTLPLDWKRISPISQAVLIGALSWNLFWKSEEL